VRADDAFRRAGGPAAHQQDRRIRGRDRGPLRAAAAVLAQQPGQIVVALPAA
jgi:hypothetical protein